MGSNGTATAAPTTAGSTASATARRPTAPSSSSPVAARAASHSAWSRLTDDGIVLKSFNELMAGASSSTAGSGRTFVKFSS
ncbi:MULTISPECIES: hypothetical protein [unclassified Micromonospora]|uniref:hypothetical protein n=1 Tax=unclassified Micromonospora TaxID=2617518 RepID=UPI00098D086B|nr:MULTISPECIES: hypothetical protein [unclassified Micromonospora]OON32576.1 hypothetical protein BSA16_04980 [Micromonospora sp. Rc5]